MEGANISLNGQNDHEASSDRWVRTDRLRVERQEKGVNCPPQWLPVLLASHQSAPLTRRRRLVDHVFTSTAVLRTAAQEYNANATSAIATYGAIADWDVSAITDMSRLFKDLKNFNADISDWDTSGVTTMLGMFEVRSSPCPAPNLQSSPRLHAACTAVARRPPDPPHLAPHRMPSFRPSAGRVGVQPAAELRHLQRHDHGLHVLRALLPVPCPQTASRALPCTLLAPRLSTACCPPTRTLRLAPHTLVSTLGSARRRSTSR